MELPKINVEWAGEACGGEWFRFRINNIFLSKSGIKLNVVWVDFGLKSGNEYFGLWTGDHCGQLQGHHHCRRSIRGVGI
jgi:hypothetical protein